MFQTIAKLVNQSKTAGAELKMIETPILYQPVAIGMMKGETALLTKVNETLREMDAAGEINAAWDKWLGPGTEYRMTRSGKVVPLAELDFTPIP